MQNSYVQKRRKEAGFTLVELAIVMIIVGLLIGGILKGQELINNAALTSTVAQTKAISTAVNTFRDQFNALPGDITNPGPRLAGCTGVCATAGNGNNQIGGAPGTNGGGAIENMTFWMHLHRADLITGIDGTNNAQWGQGMPAADINGGFNVGFSAGALGNNPTARGGNYLTIQAAPAALGGVGTSALTPSQAARIDGKMDDGSPSAGAVFPTAVATCAAANATVYLETNNPLDCELFIRL